MESNNEIKESTKKSLSFIGFVKMAAGKIPESIKPYAVLLLHSVCMIMLLYPVDIDKIIINLLFVLPVAGLLLLISNFKVSCIGESVITFALYYANEYVIAARGQPLNFLDVYNVVEALRVSGRYKPPVSVWIIIHTLLFVLVTVLSFKLLNKISAQYSKKTLKSSVAGGIASFGSIGIITLITVTGLLKTEAGGWDEQGFFLEYGFFYGLYNQYIESKAVPPDDYTSEKMTQLKTVYAASDNDQKTVPTNVVVVMNEAFADFDIVGDTDMTDSPLKNWHGLKDNCVKGDMYVNIFGGGTSVTEFEFLTGCSMAFIPVSTPYTQIPLNDCQSLSSDLRNLEYNTTAVHPYYGKEWRRLSVYPQLGFNDFISGETFVEGFDFKPDAFNPDYSFPYFGEAEYYRRLISDAECYKKISSLDKEGKDFIFCVTMQNHGGYGFDFTYDDMKEYIPEGKQPKYSTWNNKHYNELISGLGQETVPAANQYLNLTYISDEALAEYLEKLRNSDEPTVFVMFGDHQPALEFEWYNSKYSDGGNEYQKLADYYVVPYLMWANYEVDWEQHDKISVNYLSAVLKKSCGLPLNEFDNVRLAAMEEYPVITSYFAVNKNGDFVAPEEVTDSEVMNDYYLMQYDKLEQCKHK